MAQQINIFIAYSRTDTAYLQKIKKYLKVFERRKEITIWYDGEIVAGEFWNKSITKKLESADMILLLVSADSLASDYFHQKEMLKALERHLVEVLVVPIILKDCLWEDDLGDIQVLPKDGVPIVKWKYESEAYTNIARGVKASIVDAKKMKQNRLKKLEEEYNDELKATKKKLEDTEAILESVKNDLTKKEKVVEYLKHQIVEQDALFKKNEKGLKASLKQSETEKQVLKQHILEREKAVKVLETEKNKLLKKIKSLETANKNVAKFKNLWEKAKNENEMLKVQILQFEKKKEENTFFTAKTNKKLPKVIEQQLNDMIKVEGGSFMMGSNNGRDNEKPIHKVELDSFYISKYQVTQEVWEAVMGKNPSYFKGCARCPVETVSWNDTQLFLKKLNEMTGKNFRLPTEAEWEYVARGGQKSKGYKYAGSNNIDEVAWYRENSNAKTNEVGLKKANEVGIYDMSGNVWEWCEDWYDRVFYENAVKNNPINKKQNIYRVLRGGGWNHNVAYCRVAFRIGDSLKFSNSGVGFRLASSL